MSKYKEGDKFIIEIAEVTIQKNGTPRYFIKGFNTLVFDDNGLDRLETQDSLYDFFNDYIQEVKRIANKNGFKLGKHAGLEERAEQIENLFNENEKLEAQIDEMRLANKELYEVNAKLLARLAKVQEVAKGEEGEE